MIEKFKKKAKNFSELLTEDSSVQKLYNEFEAFMKKNEEFTSHFSANDQIILFFYIYSYKKTGDFVLGDKILSNLMFAKIFITHLDSYVGLCPDCGGEGVVNCGECNGNSYVRCNCDDDEDCDKCGGEGEYECPDCDFSGVEACKTCDEDGEVTTNDVLYDEYDICTWNKLIKDRCELTVVSDEPMMSEDNFNYMLDELVILRVYDQEHGELVNSIEPGQFYCEYYSDDPKLIKHLNRLISIPGYYMGPYLA